MKILIVLTVCHIDPNGYMGNIPNDESEGLEHSAERSSENDNFARKTCIMI